MSIDALKWLFSHDVIKMWNGPLPVHGARLGFKPPPPPMEQSVGPDDHFASSTLTPYLTFNTKEKEGKPAKSNTLHNKYTLQVSKLTIVAYLRQASLQRGKKINVCWRL